MATLFEVMDFLQDSTRQSVTSGPCLWVKRASADAILHTPQEVTELQTNLGRSR